MFTPKYGTLHGVASPIIFPVFLGHDHHIGEEEAFQLGPFFGIFPRGHEVESLELSESSDVGIS